MKRTTRILEAMADGERWTVAKLASELECREKDIHNSVSVLRNALCIQPGPRTNGYSEYVITGMGRERLAKRVRKQVVVERIPTIPTVALAIQSRPILQTIWR